MFRKIFKIRHLIVASIVLTAGYIVIFQDEVISHYEITPAEVPSTWGGPSQAPHKFCSYPDGTDSNLLLVTDYISEGLIIRLWNPYTRYIIERHLPGYSLNAVAEREFGDVWADTLNRCAYYIATKNGADYYLLKISGDTKQGLFIRPYFLLRHPAYDRLKDSIYNLHSISFNGCLLENHTTDSISVDPYGSYYRLRMSRNIYDTLRPYFVAEGQSFHRYHYLMAKKLTETTGRSFSPLDAARLFYFYNAYEWWKDYFFGKPYINEKNGFLSATVWGQLDANRDGHPDLLISIYTIRYVNQWILCYDIHNEKILWKREFAQHIPYAKIADIDQDGQPEIMFSSYAPCNSPDMDYFDKWTETGLPHYAYFRILNADGSDKIINTKKMEYRYPQRHHYNLITFYIPAKRSILMGLHNDFDFSEKDLLRYDLQTNEVTETGTKHHAAVYLNTEDHTIVLFDVNIHKQSDDIIRRIHLNPDGSIQQLVSTHLFSNGLRFDFVESPYTARNPYRLFGKKFYISNNMIFDSELRPVYVAPYSFNRALWKNDEVFFTTYKGNVPHFIWYRLYRTHQPKIWLFWLLGAELFVGLIYLIIRRVIVAPIERSNENYAIVYSFLGKLFYFQLKGTIALFVTVNNRFFLSENEIESLLNELDKSYELKKTMQLLVVKVKSYAINPKHAQIVFTTVAHHLKNYIHYLPLPLLEAAVREYGDEERYGAILSKLRTEFEKIQQLSRDIVVLTRSADTRDRIHLSETIERITDGYFRHPLYARIILQPEPLPELYVSIHPDSLELAMRNVIDNALYELQQVPDGKLVITIVPKDRVAEVIVENPFVPDRPKKESSTGFGLMASQYLIEKFKGDFRVQAKENRFTVTIRLPLAVTG